MHIPSDANTPEGQKRPKSRKSRMSHHFDPVVVEPRPLYGEHTGEGAPDARAVNAAPSLFRPRTEGFAPTAPQEGAADDDGRIPWDGPGELVGVDDDPTSHPIIKDLSSMRISWIDIAKGIALFFVMLSAVSSSFAEPWAEGITRFCSSFAFPLLFVMCGYTTDRSDFSLSRVRHLAYRYLVPYLAAMLLIVLISCSISGDWDVASWAWSFLFASGGIRGTALGTSFTHLHLISVGVLWILPVLFLARVASYLLSYIPMVTRVLVSGVIFILASATSGDVFLPLTLQASGCALWFMTCGMMFREQELFHRLGWERALVAIVSTIGLSYVIVLTAGFADAPEYGVAFFHQPAIDMLGGVCAALAFMLLSQIVSEITGVFDNILEWIGRNIVPLICWDEITLAFAPAFWALVSTTPLGSLPPAVLFVIGCAFVYVLTALLSLVSYKVPFLHCIFCSSASSSSALVDLEKHNSMSMTLIEEQEVV